MKKYLFTIILLAIMTSFTVYASEDNSAEIPPAAETQSSQQTPEAQAPTPTETSTQAPETKSPAEESTEYKLPQNLTGTGTVITSERAEDGKVFYTIEADDGTVFYLIIDNNNVQENVYFLSPVTYEDLLSLAKLPAESENETSGTSGISQETEPVTENPDVGNPPQKTSWLMQNLPVIIIFVLAIIIVTAYYLFKIKIRKSKKPSSPQEYEDLDDYEEEIREKDDDIDEE